LFEAAHTGTVFLDEIGDMPISLQTRLLRVLQEREVVRLGSNAPIAIDVRVIAATHRSLENRIAEGLFRADLFYRLNILLVSLPPLRERPEDLHALASQLLEAKLLELGSTLSAEPLLLPLLPLLRQYRWPGNIRELENLMERFAVFLFGLPESGEVEYSLFLREAPELAQGLIPELTAAVEEEAPVLLDDARILAALQAAKGSRQGAAQALSISRTTLWRRLKEIEALDRSP
jgi:propionate catabolism operon transcriptional regulator